MPGLWLRVTATIRRKQKPHFISRRDDMISGDFNDAPDDMIEISEADFSRLFFHYCYKKYEFRQIELLQMANVKLFELEYASGKGLGVAIMQNYYKSKYGLTYFRFGNKDKWEIFSKGFASQFDGDLS
jgi:hypothetical protein